MFRIITNLLFGEEDKPIESICSAEVVDEDWHVISHQDAVSAEDQGVVLHDQEPSPVVHVATTSVQEKDSVTSQESPVQNKNKTHRSVSGVISQPKAQVAQFTCVQKAKAWTERHTFSRNAVQRQNRIRQGVHHQAFHLHQPGHRNLCH